MQYVVDHSVKAASQASNRGPGVNPGPLFFAFFWCMRVFVRSKVMTLSLALRFDRAERGFQNRPAWRWEEKIGPVRENGSVLRFANH
jgi:hypothetical protein